MGRARGGPPLSWMEDSMKRKVVFKGWVAKVKGKKIPSDRAPQVYHLRCDAVAMKDPGDSIVRVEVHELIKG